MKIHKEGHALLIVLLIVFDLMGAVAYVYLPLHWFWVVAAVLLLIFLAVLQFFRHPGIEPVTGEDLVVAPADGKVVTIEETVETEYLKENRKQISIFMSPVNVHVNRSPIAGIIKYYKYHYGKYLVAWHPKSSTDNERTTLVIEHHNGLELVVRQIAGAVARRIKCYVDTGDKVEQGGEFGFIKFGSRVDVFVPTDAEILVSEGDKTRAGVTVLARVRNTKSTI